VSVVSHRTAMSVVCIDSPLYGLYIVPYKTKLESVSFSCKSHCSETVNIKILSADSMHRC